MFFTVVGYLLLHPTYAATYNFIQLPLQEQELATNQASIQASDTPLPDTVSTELPNDSGGAIDSSLEPNVDSTTQATPPPLERPLPIDPLPIERVYPYETIDRMVVKQSVNTSVFVPLVQEIAIGMEVLSLGSNAWQLIKNIRKYDSKRPYAYEATCGIRFRKNIRLVGDLGYSWLYPDRLQENYYRYKVQGIYGRVGLDYVMPYTATEYFSLGVRYAGARLGIHTIDPVGNKRSLTASWFEAVIGAESAFFDKLPIYGGCTMRAAWLIDFFRYRPAKNYYIPGYGLNANKYTMGIDLHLLYKFSFLERMFQVA